MKGVNSKECCMCGDKGFPHHLFHCTTCLRRSQHTYCSCLYPKAENYQVCDWCLRSGEDRKPSKQIMDYSKTTQSDGRKVHQQAMNNSSDRQRNSLLPGQHAIKKQKSTAETVNRVGPTATSAKPQKLENERFVKEREEGAENGVGLNCAKDGIMRCSEDFSNKPVPIAISNASTPRLVRAKVRRYKLLEEVSS